MAVLDWSQCPAVESVPGRLGGAWVFRDTRMPVSAVFENLEAGSNIEEIVEQFDVTREQIVAVLDFAARSLDAVPVAITASKPRLSMLILFDHGTPRGIARVLSGHMVTRAKDRAQAGDCGVEHAAVAGRSVVSAEDCRSGGGGDSGEYVEVEIPPR